MHVSILQNPVSMKDIREFGERVCTMSVDQVKSAFPNVANGEATDLCFDVSFIYQHLSEGRLCSPMGFMTLVVRKLLSFYGVLR